MSKPSSLSTILKIDQIIHTVRDQRVILDSDLARIYGVPTKALNQAVKRNAGRFPADFAFQLTPSEVAGFLRSQIVTSKGTANRSQFVTGSQKHRDPKYRPYAFTEHGALMAANLLRSHLGGPGIGESIPSLHGLLPSLFLRASIRRRAKDEMASDRYLRITLALKASPTNLHHRFTFNAHDYE